MVPKASKFKAYSFALLDFCAVKLLQFTGNDLVSRFEKQFLQETGSPRVHYKINFLMRKCAGKKVIHFGFVDSPFTGVSVHGDTFLHLQLRAVCGELLGVDYDSAAVELYKKATGDPNVVAADIYDLEMSRPRFQNAEIFLMGEILEHLANPGLALKSIRDSMPDSAVLLLTVPNAYSFGPLKGSLNGVEIVHHDHKAWYSVFTLQALMKSCGFKTDEMAYYVSGKGDRVGRFSKAFPSLSEGMIGVFSKDGPR